MSPVLRVLCAALFCLTGSWLTAAAPKAPTIKSAGLSDPNFSTTLVNGSRGVLVQWTDNSNDEDFFVLYSRKGTSGAFGRTAQASANSINSALVPLTQSFPVGTVFQFAVAACKGVYSTDRTLKFEGDNANGWALISEQSAMSSPITINWPSGASGMAAPSGLSAAATDDGNVRFQFTDNSNSEEVFELNLRLASQTAETDWKTIKTFFGLSADYYWPFNLTDHTLRIALSPGVAYQFRIRAVRAAAGGTATEATDWSNTATMTMPGLSAPTGLVAETPAENTISFTWADNSANEQGYFLERKLHTEDDTSWGIYETLPANSTIITISPFELPGVANDWRVSAAYATGANDTQTVSLASCVLNTAADTDGSTTVTCTSTTGLKAGATLTGPVISLTGATTAASASVTTTSTASLAVGMFLQGTGLQSGTRVLSIDSATTFTMSAHATATGAAVAITATHLFPGTRVSSITNTTTFVLNAPAFVNTTAAAIALTATTTTPIYSRGTSNVVTVTTSFNAPTGLQAPQTDNAADPFSVVNLSWTDNSNGEDGFQIRYRLASDSETDASYTQAALISSSTSAAPQTVRATLTSQLLAGKNLVIRVRAYVSSSSTTVFSEQTLQASVTTKNAFTSRPYFPATKGTAITPFNVQTTSNTTIADNAGTPDISITGLPAGLTFTPTATAVAMTEAGVISGTPTEAGLFKCSMKATFTGGLSATSPLTLRVLYPKAPPTTPQVISSRTLAPNSPVFIPLSDLFADKDTEQAVKFTIQTGANAAEEVKVVLYPSLVPETVSNFMNYVLSNDYENVVFNRLAAGFVLQGGSYKFLPSLSTSTPLFTNVLSRTSPINEPGISNVGGTIAMAKLPSDPNSATHDFFFSFGDNSANLDLQNGGFTAFGRVAGTGMSVINTIGALKTTPDAPAHATDADTRYSINVRDPFGGATKAQTVGTFPVTKTTVPIPGSILSNEMVVIKSITPIENLLTYATTNSDSGKVSVSIVDGTQLRLEGLAVGSSAVTVSATDLDNTTTQQSFTVTVQAGYVQPAITTHPLDKKVNKGGSVSFSVVAVGTDATFLWKKNGVALTDATPGVGTTISGATTATLTLGNVQLTDSASYTVAVTNNAGIVISNVGHLTVLDPPVITPLASPPTITLKYLESTTLSTSATGTEPIQYTWYVGGREIPNVASSSIRIGPVTSAHDGVWTVVATNEAGASGATPGITIATVTVTIPDSDKDGLSDEVEDNGGTDKTKADTDGDGYTDGVEQNLGTNPKLASSTPASKYFVAERDGTATMGNVLMKRIAGNSELSTSAYWLGATELTNKQFASILQYGLKKSTNISITTEGARRAVRFPSSGGQIICYLADTTPIGIGDPPATDISTTDGNASFIVPVALINAPVRGVSWEAAYFAAASMNSFHGFGSKNLAGSTFEGSSVPGYRIPGDIEWEAAARGGRPAAQATYPTGTSLSSSQAWFGQTSLLARPKNVSSYAANPFGCSDLAGNVAEWVFEPNGVSSYTRGGGFSDVLTALRTDAKALTLRTTIDRRIGIRLALDAAPTPSITRQPSNTDTPPLLTPFVLARTDETLEILTTATGAPPLAFQWLRNNANVSGQTNAKLSIAAPKTTDAGSYQMRVTTNGVSPQLSSVTKVNIVQLPATRSFTIASTKDITFTVPFGTASGETLTFAWFKGSTLLQNRGSYITGSATNSLVLKNCQPADTANYVCQIKDSHGSPAVTVGFSLLVLGLPLADTPIFTETTMVGESFVYQISSTTANITQAPTTYSAVGLPSGLTINATNGVISGKPLVSGIFHVTIKVTNAVGSFTTQSVTLTVKSMAEMGQDYAVGSFFGLIDRHTGSVATNPGLNDNLGGRIDFTVSKSATLSGKLILGSTPYSFSGSLNTVYNPATPVNPSTSIVIKRSGKTSLGLVLTMPVEMPQQFTGTLFELDSSGNATSTFSDLLGYRNQWSSSLPAAAYSGKHNILLRIPTGSISDETIPQGSGYANINVGLTGSTTLAGKLPDGTSISFSSFLGSIGQHGIYQVLYSGKGSILGAFKESSDSHHAFTGRNSISWLKKVQATTSTDRLYKTNGIATALTPFGGSYDPPTAFLAIMGLPASTVPNAQLSFEYGGLVPSTGFTQDFRIAPPAAVSFTGATVNNATTFTVNGSTGAFNGTFKLIDDNPVSTTIPKAKITRSVTYQGLIVRNPGDYDHGIGEGYFILDGLPVVGGVTSSTSPRLSGWVGLGAKP